MWAWGSKWEILRVLQLGTRCTQSPRCLYIGNWVEHTLMSSLRHVQTPKFKCLSLKMILIWCFTFKELLIFQTDLLLVKETCVFVSLFFPKKKKKINSLQTFEYFQKTVLYLSVLFSIFHIYALCFSDMTCPLFMIVLHGPLGHLGK